jgi:DNA-binding NtrC family response regulator
MKSRPFIQNSTEIMIIDDDEDVLNLFSDFLAKEGYNVKPFLDPFRAIEELQERPQKYSLIITDIRMPGMSGIELITKLSKINQAIKVIMMSAFDLNGDDLKDIGYEKFIQKPVHMRSLLQTIDKILKS